MTTIWVEGLPVDVPSADYERDPVAAIENVRRTRAELRLPDDGEQPTDG